MATWQAAEPGSVVGDNNGNYQIRVSGQWQPMPKGSLIADEHGAYHFDSDAIKPPAAPKAAAAPKDPIGEANKAADASEHGPVQDVIDMVKAVPGGLIPALKGLLSGAGATLNTGIGTHIGQNAENVANAVSNPSQTLTSIGSTLQNATPEQVGRNVVAPIVAGGAVNKIGGLAAGAGAGAGEAEAAAPPLGMVTGENNPIARNLAGSSARPAATAHNQTIADQHLGAQVGVQPGTPLGGKTPDGTPVLEGAKKPANAVYSRVEANLPTAPLSPAAEQAVQGVNANDLIVRSPNTQAIVEAQKERLLSRPLSGPEVVDTQRTLRHNGFRNQGSLDPENQELGRAQLQMADALHQHMVDTLPPNADVSVEQLVQARQSLAQINTLQDLLKGNNVDLQALAKRHRDNPGLFTGAMGDIADFADKHPEVTGLPSNEERFNPSGVTKDIAAIDLKKPLSYVQPLVGGAARRAITGAAPPPPTTGLAAELAPIARPPVAGEAPGAAQAEASANSVPSTKGITATPIEPKLGDVLPGQRGAVGPPTDIGGLRQLMNNPRTYGGGPAVPKTKQALELEAALKKLTEQPTTYSGIPLGKAF